MLSYYHSPTTHDLFSLPPNPLQGHQTDLSIYRSGGEPYEGYYITTMPFMGEIPNDEYKLEANRTETDEYEIGYTQWGDKGPVVLLLHGVPTNRRQYYPIQRLLSPFCRTISIDMLGMGESSKPLNYGYNSDEKYPWNWKHDTIYIRNLMKDLFPNDKFLFVADDWGGGIATHYASLYSEDLLGLVLIDPIALDGYPVNEIQAIGRASQLDNKQFMKAMGAFDQTVVQIMKTMVYDSSVFNQYNIRDLTFPYVDNDYERSDFEHGENASSLTLRLKYNNIRALADRSAPLAPALLLPYHSEKNPSGVNYEDITAPVMVLWGKQDHMMPANQRHRFRYLLRNTQYRGEIIDQAGHFAGIDQPIRVAEHILDFTVQFYGINSLADIFLGFDGIWKGDEAELIEYLRHMH